ncbi:hypothetical protein ACCO45_005752 [Purpureocillium lilacinum]|uniref:Uncharacterized protein n=1 Tax=Purpureocillium lilacinum TaxID=33203 RepID=A0ACC4DZ78_PURLI
MPHYGTTGTYRIIQGGPVENALGLANPTPNAPPPRRGSRRRTPVPFYSDPANVYESASRPVSASMSPASAYSGYDASVSDMTEDGHNDDGYDDYDAYYDDDERTLCCDVQDHGDESPEPLGAAAGAEGDDDNDDDEQPEMSSPPPQGDDPRPRVRRRPSARRDKFPPGPSPLSYPPLLSRTLPSAE